MSLFGKIFGGKSGPEPAASAGPSHTEEAAAAGQSAASEDVPQARGAGVAAADRVRSLQQPPDNDAAPPSIVIAGELGALAVVTSAPSPSRSALPIPKPDAGVQVAPGKERPPPAVSRATTQHTVGGPKRAPSTRGDTTARTARPGLKTPPREQPTLRATKRARLGAAESEPEPQRPLETSRAAVTKPDRETQLRALSEAHRSHLLHIQQFALDLDLGCAPVRWATACKSAVAALARGAEQLELPDVLAAAQVLGGELSSLAKAREGATRAEAKESALRGYAALAQFAGDALHPVPDGRAREQLVVAALLHGVRGVHALTFDKLTEAGALSIAALASAAATDLSATTGLEPALVERILARVAEVVSGHGRATAGEVRGILVGQCKQALAAFEDSHTRFLQAEADENGPGKRAARRGRDGELCVLEGLFARLGELGAAQDLQRGSMPQRIERARALVAQWSD